ncbi:MAG: cysteine--tRNA ligase [Chloroflexia bacterium]|nr:cysteine--tRNA ligase [Chloroflexia bacterium]
MTTSDPVPPQLRIYNTLTRTVEPFQTIEPGVVRMYVCGVTVYDSAHIGHGMSAVVFDMVRRYLEHRGYTVRHAQNFTDVDDKIIARANRERIDPNDLVERLIADWHRELKALNVLPATVYPRATLEIPQIIAMIEGLIAKGHAYRVAGDVYFSVRSFPDYGKLSHRDIDDLLSGARIEVDERKRDPLDFALWKSAKPGEPMWESPWSQGRPGWHIECSAMCSHHLDGVVDIHGGGADLIFPHHENEIAQSEAYLGKEPFARYWVHNGWLQLGDQKMSKSLGNVINLSDILQRRLTAEFRLMVLQSHYRAPLTYTEDVLMAARNGLDRLRAAVRSPKIANVDEGHHPGHGTSLDTLIAATDERFHAAMDNDFNTPVALAALFELGRAINRSLANGDGHGTVAPAQGKLRTLAEVLGLDLDEPTGEGSSDVAPFVELLVTVRAELRDAKQWGLADRIRDGLSELGVSIEDEASGTTWRRR